MAKLLTHCKRGHELYGDNLYVSPKGCRGCRTCREEYRLTHSKPYNPDRAKVWRDKWNDKNPEYFKNHWLKRAYGLTPEEYETMWEAQDGICPICKDPLVRDKTTHVDHDHTTGKVRELLHQTCNHGIGSLRDNPEFMENAAAYIRKHREIHELSCIL